MQPAAVICSVSTVEERQVLFISRSNNMVGKSAMIDELDFEPVYPFATQGDKKSDDLSEKNNYSIKSQEQFIQCNPLPI